MPRKPLAVLAALAAGLLLPVLPAQAAAPPKAPACAGPRVETFGPASMTGAIVGATVHEGKAYVVTRGQKPPVLAEIDLGSRKVVRSVRLPDGPATGEPEGGWATTVADGKIYVGTYPVPDLYRFDPATGEVVHLASFGRNGGYIWALAAAPDGTVFAGTYPDGRVKQYVPATGAVRDFGVLAPASGTSGRWPPTPRTSTRACSTRASSSRSTARAAPSPSWPRAPRASGWSPSTATGSSRRAGRPSSTCARTAPTSGASRSARTASTPWPWPPTAPSTPPRAPTAPSTATAPATARPPRWPTRRRRTTRPGGSR
ncbi:hypothetical protein ACFQ0B_41825 [Nonomuraea thailandensis]